MNQPLAFVCACIAAVGLLIIGYSIYGTVVYGDGHMEAGNFTQYEYVRMGDGTRTYLQPPTGERSTIVMAINTWVVGGALVVIGAGLFFWDRADSQKHHF